MDKNSSTQWFALEDGTMVTEKEFMRRNRIPNMAELIWKEIRRDPFAIISVLIILFFLIVAFVWGNLIDESAVARLNIMRRDLPPSQFSPLGTDEAGRPMLQWLIVSWRNSLMMSIIITIPIIISGTVIGLFIGYYGKYADFIVLRLVDIISMVPNLMVVILMSAILPQWRTWEFAFVMIALGWFGSARLIRARCLQEQAKDYVMASKTLGTHNVKIIFKKIFPNVLSFALVSGILTFASMIGFEVGLTVLGYGLPVGTPSIGRFISAAMNPIVLANRQWQWVPAVLIIFLFSISILGLGEAVKRGVNPRQRR